MNEFYGLLLVLVAVYLSECICWAPENSQAFRGRGLRWRVATPLLNFPALHKNIQIRPILPAFGSVALSELHPAPLAPAGLVLGGADGPQLQSLEQLEADGEVIKQNGKVILRTGAAAYA